MAERKKATRKKTTRKKTTTHKKTTRKKAASRKKATRKYGTASRKKINRVMHEFGEGQLKSGRSGKKVKSRKQAIAIRLE